MSTPFPASPFSLAGKVALVTGGGEGLGQAASIQLAKAGAALAVLGRSAENVANTCQAIENAGGTALALTGDVSKPSSLARAFDRLKRRFGRLDIVFANAGVNGVWAPLEQLKIEEWDETIAINLRGAFLTLQSAWPLMKKRGGSIIVTASVNGTRMFSNTGATAYAVSKAGQVALARMCALEFAPQKIRVNTICPGAIESHIDDNTQKRDLRRVRFPVTFPAGKIPLTKGQPGSAEQVADLVLFLASDASSHITGTEIYIDGAESLLRG